VLSRSSRGVLAKQRDRCRQQVSSRLNSFGNAWACGGAHLLASCRTSRRAGIVVRAAPAVTVSDRDDALQTERSRDPCTPGGLPDGDRDHCRGECCCVLIVVIRRYWMIWAPNEREPRAGFTLLTGARQATASHAYQGRCGGFAATYQHAT